eukprot:3940898-Rhodomonas_salina.4
MCGTERAYAAMLVLHAVRYWGSVWCYTFATRCPILFALILQVSSYRMVVLLYRMVVPMQCTVVLTCDRAERIAGSYAMCGTELAYGATRCA